MKALVATQEVVFYVSGWTTETIDGVTKNIPTSSPVTNGCRIAQVEENTFEVHSDLIWVDCDSSVTSDTHYYDESDSTIKTFASINVDEPA
jgi:hypothetical protein